MRRHNVVQYCKSAMVVLRFKELCIIACMGGMLYKSTTVHTEQCGGVGSKRNGAYSDLLTHSHIIAYQVLWFTEQYMVEFREQWCVVPRQVGCCARLYPSTRFHWSPKKNWRRKMSLSWIKRNWKCEPWVRRGLWTFVPFLQYSSDYLNKFEEEKWKNANLESGELGNCLQTLLQMLKI